MLHCLVATDLNGCHCPGGNRISLRFFETFTCLPKLGISSQIKAVISANTGCYIHVITLVEPGLYLSSLHLSQDNVLIAVTWFYRNVKSMSCPKRLLWRKIINCLILFPHKDVPFFLCYCSLLCDIKISHLCFNSSISEAQPEDSLLMEDQNYLLTLTV